MSFRITEEYVQAAMELERSGYAWQPGPGDWIVDRDDQSIGLLTMPVKRPEMIRRLNTHLPTHAQVDELLSKQGLKWRRAERVEFLHGADLVADFSIEEYEDDQALCRIRALTAWFARQPARRARFPRA